MGNIKYYKIVHHPIPTGGNREHPGNFQNKSVSSAFSWVPRYIFFLVELKRIWRPFLESEKRGATLQDYPQEHLVVIGDEKVSAFVKFEIILPLLYFLLDLLQIAMQDMEFYDKFVDRFQDISKIKNHAVSKAKV